jgi:hypothetical protein
MTQLLNQRQMLMLQGNVVQGTCTKLLQEDRDSCILNPNEHNGVQIEKIDHYRWAQHLAIDLSSLCRYLLCSRASQTGTSAEDPLKQNQQQNYRTLMATVQHFHDKLTQPCLISFQPYRSKLIRLTRRYFGIFNSAYLV